MDRRAERDHLEGGVDGSLPGSGPWLLQMRWTELLFAHWRIPVQVAKAIIPEPLEPDEFDGSGWLGLVPFRMSDVRPRWVPPVPGISAFPEVNVRTYARYRGRPGVWFLSLDAAGRVAVEVARRATGLPYYRARMSLTTDAAGWRDFRSEREDSRGAGGRFDCRYRPSGPVRAPTPLERFLTQRDGLWAMKTPGQPRWLAIRHDPWPLQPAELVLGAAGQSLTDAAGVPLDGPPQHLCFSQDLRVAAWRPHTMPEP